MSLGDFCPLFDIPGVEFFSLQIAVPASDASTLQSRASVVRDLSAEQRDFADTAAIVRQLDLVITVDTSLLHLAGGLGLPAWGLISRRSDWRWLDHDRTETPWYPSVRLFRQRRLGDWDELMQRVAGELYALLERMTF
jgi:ADP-heptose:LPS heptosyltransferase